MRSLHFYRHIANATNEEIALFCGQIGSPVAVKERLYSYENITVVKCLRDIYQEGKTGVITYGGLR